MTQHVAVLGSLATKNSNNALYAFDLAITIVRMLYEHKGLVKISFHHRGGCLRGLFNVFALYSYLARVSRNPIGCRQRLDMR